MLWYVKNNKKNKKIGLQEELFPVKPIPEDRDDGEVDPGLYKSMRFMPKPKKNAAVEEQVAMPMLISLPAVGAFFPTLKR